MHVKADAFCRSMVRSLAGALIPVGQGRKDREYPAQALEKRSRDAGIAVMPAHALVLEVGYPPAEQWGNVNGERAVFAPVINRTRSRTTRLISDHDPILRAWEPVLHHTLASPDRNPSGDVTGGRALATEGDMEVGVWEHSVGVSTDVEVEEVFVVLSGRGTVTCDSGGRIDLAPGVVGLLPMGAQTTWTVTEPLRKVWITLSWALPVEARSSPVWAVEAATSGVR